MPRAKSNRCTYREGKRRCQFAGRGDPALCDPHRAVLIEASRPQSPVSVITEAAINFMSGKPINREATIGAIETFVEHWSGGIGSGYRPDVSSGERESRVHQRAQPGHDVPWWTMPGAQRRGQAQPPPPPPNEEIERQRKIAAARQVMGFALSEPLTREVVQQRHRKLVRKHHPDHGGSTEKMMAINNARDVLLAEM